MGEQAGGHAAIGDVAHPSWRASAVGVHRLWRDLGYAFGAVAAGVTADAIGLSRAIWLGPVITFASGLGVALRMTETLRQPAPAAGARCLEPTELRRIPDALIIDVRSPEEFAVSHVDGAINLPLDAPRRRRIAAPEGRGDRDGLRQGRRTLRARRREASRARLPIGSLPVRRDASLAAARRAWSRDMSKADP